MSPIPAPSPQRVLSTAIVAGTDLTLNNSGIIQAIHRAITGGNVSIINTNTIVVNGVAGSSASAIQAGVLNLDNSQSIFVTGTDAVGAVEVFGNGTIKNSGTIVSDFDNTFAIKSDFWRARRQQSVRRFDSGNGANGFAINAATNATVANAGRIEATGAGGIAIQALNGTATVNNIGDGITTGVITADAFAIKGGAAKLTGNTGLIEATGIGGFAIFAGGTAEITNAGKIQATRRHRHWWSNRYRGQSHRRAASQAALGIFARPSISPPMPA